MTQKQLAEKLGVSAQYVNKLVKGNEKFGGEILVKLEEVLDMPIFVQNLPREKQELLKEEKLDIIVLNSIANAIKDKCLDKFDLKLDVMLIDMNGNILNNNHDFKLIK